MNLPALERLRALEAAGRHASFKDAAEEIGVTPSAVSHRIRALEAELGASLFNRNGGGVQLTNEGELLSKSVARGLAQIQATWTDIVLELRGRPIRISCAPVFASRFLLSRLNEFNELRPNLRLEIVSTNKLADIENGACDLGIRLSPRPPAPLHSERLMSVSVLPVCSSDHRHQLVDKRTIRGPLLGMVHQPNAWDKFRKVGNLPVDEDVTTLWFDSLEDILSAIYAGAGIGLLPDWLAYEARSSHGIESLLEDPIPSGLSYWMTMRRGEKESRNLAAVRKWIKRNSKVEPLRSPGARQISKNGSETP